MFFLKGAPQQQQSQQQNKKEKQPQKEQETNEKSGADGQKKRTLEGGVIIHDIKVGNGPLCKPGRMVSYEMLLSILNKLRASSFVDGKLFFFIRSYDDLRTIIITE